MLLTGTETDEMTDYDIIKDKIQKSKQKIKIDY